VRGVERFVHYSSAVFCTDVWDVSISLAPLCAGKVFHINYSVLASCIVYRLGLLAGKLWVLEQFPAKQNFCLAAFGNDSFGKSS
jgi:hypothetical protein